MKLNLKENKIAIIGLGYVGLPLAVEFAKQYRTIGFDINNQRVGELRDGHDHTLEVEDKELQAVLLPNIKEVQDKNGLFVTDAITDIGECNIYIVTVPTPINDQKQPILTPLTEASKTVGGVLNEGDLVIYESTVYPGLTEEHCVPILEKQSGFTYNEDFFLGYSPERINPGDKKHTVANILKVTSGSTPEIAELVDQLYASVIRAGTFKAASIKVAEAAKVIENSQRDINIAFVNELSKIFNRLGIDTQDVLAAARTKWNFLPFQPGLVGGHCIGVDPYYLAQKAQEVGYHPEIILAGRRLNDGMGAYVAQEVIKLMIKNQRPVLGAKILVLGITFKENCPDIRNSKVIDMVRELKSYDTIVEVYDPWADPEEVMHEYGIDLITDMRNDYEAIILAVSHNQFLELNIADLKQNDGVIYDVKGILQKEVVNSRL
jgi:UDP-N-acetyl-D-galactosamine dehydrogenase